MRYFTKQRLLLTSVIIICIFGALRWYFVQKEQIRTFEQITQYKTDIENAFRPIDEKTVSMFNRISDQEIRTEQRVDEEGKNEYLQYKYSYLSAKSTERRIELIREYSIVFQKQLSQWEKDRVLCDFHVCKTYAQYANNISVEKDRYRALKNILDTKLPVHIYQTLHPEAFNL